MKWMLAFSHERCACLAAQRLLSFCESRMAYPRSRNIEPVGFGLCILVRVEQSHDRLRFVAVCHDNAPLSFAGAPGLGYAVGRDRDRTLVLPLISHVVPSVVIFIWAAGGVGVGVGLSVAAPRPSSIRRRIASDSVFSRARKRKSSIA